MHDFQEQCQVHGQQCQVRGQRSKNGFYNKKIRIACIITQLLDSVFVISGIIKVSISVISLSRTLTSTLIIPDITKTSSNNCLLFRTRLPLTGQYGFQNRDKVYMSPIQFCSRKSLSFPLLGITSPSVFDTGYKLELTGYRTNLGLTSVKVFT